MLWYNIAERKGFEMDFSDIVLSREELAELRVLTERAVLVGPGNREIVNRLSDFDLADKCRSYRHEIMMCIVSATTSSVFTLLAEHFSDIIGFVQRLFQQ